VEFFIHKSLANKPAQFACKDYVRIRDMGASVATAHRERVLTPPELPRENEAHLSPTDRDHLGERLRAMYDQLRDEPLPSRLQDLVYRLTQTSPE
jgi:hypothetical protein